MHGLTGVECDTLETEKMADQRQDTANVIVLDSVLNWKFDG